MRCSISEDEKTHLEREILEAQRTWTRLKVQKSRMCEPVALRTRRKLRDRNAHQEQRAQLSQEETTLRRQRDATAHQRARAQLSQEESALRKQRDAIAHQRARAQLSEEELKLRKAKDAIRHKVQRRARGSHYNMAKITQAFRDSDVEVYNVGAMSEKCMYCGAYFWQSECNTHGKYTLCCKAGKVVLPPISKPPPYINR